MNMTYVLLIYAAAFTLAIAALHFFHARSWPWHLLSIAAALALGLAPPPPEAWRGQTFDMAMGFVFVLLMVWGIGGLIPSNRKVAHHT